jgi:UDP-2,3-diacylglucosamine hydrolase
MKQLFISDLHLKSLDDPVSQRFWDFLENIAPSADELYILGDFFEVWIGDDAQNNLSKTVAEKLRQLKEHHQVTLYFMAGNRDFLIGQDYCQQAGMIRLNDPYPLPSNPSILLSHGDEQCTSDIEYQKVRQMLRDPKWQDSFLSQPLEQRIAFAKQARTQSKEHQEGYELTDLSPDAMIKQLQQYGAQLLIHGHTHQPKLEAIESNNKGHSFERLTLSDWDHDVYYAEIIDDSPPNLIKFS